MEVGERLAFYALNRQYGFTGIDCESPEAVEIFHPDGNPSMIGVRLTNCPLGLNRWREIEGLEVRGGDTVWYPVTYALYEWGVYLRITSEFVPDPKEVRYGWGDFKPGNLANVQGLPVAPFYLHL